MAKATPRQPTIDELKARLPCEHKRVTYGAPCFEECINFATELDATGAGLEREYDEDRLIIIVGHCNACGKMVARLGVVEWQTWL